MTLWQKVTGDERRWAKLEMQDVKRDRARLATSPRLRWMGGKVGQNATPFFLYCEIRCHNRYRPGRFGGGS